MEVDHPRVSFHPITHFIGPKDLALRLPFVWASLRRALRKPDVLIFRLPGTLGMLASGSLRDRPFGVELIGDPADVFGSGVGGRFAPVYSRAMVSATKHLCHSATAVAYVTETVLQRKYPPALTAFTTTYSSVELHDSLVAEAKPRKLDPNAEPRLFCAASLEVPYKGVDYLIQAIGSLKAGGTNVHLSIAGDGRLKGELRALANNLGIAERVSFLGRISHDQVLQEMRSCSLYVQPSLTEGLPRAVIEAFATGAPAVGTNVGGIPELIAENALVPPADVSALVDRICDLLRDPNQMFEISRRNIDVAKRFTRSTLNARRAEFYSTLIQAMRAPQA